MLIISCLSVSAQVDFKLQSDGSFRTIDGEDYVVIPFEGKSAHDLFVTLTSNATSIYNDVSNVMNTVQDNIVKIRGFAGSGKIFPYITFCNFSVEGYYQLVFKIKDGRIRVSAPLVEDYANMTGGNPKSLPVSYSGMVAKHLFDKNGTIKKKRVNDVASIEAYLNSIINRILAQSAQIEEEW